VVPGSRCAVLRATGAWHRSSSPFPGGDARVGLVREAGLERSKQLQARGMLFRAYGAVPADSVRPDYPASPSRSAKQWSPGGVGRERFDR
jgi:hypothetical protein